DSTEDMISFLNLDQFIIIKAVNSKETPESFMSKMNYKVKKLKDFLKFNYNLHANISIGRVAKGINGIKKSYYDALDALLAGKKINLPTGIYHYNDLDIILASLSNNLSPFIIERVSHKVEDFM